METYIEQQQNAYQTMCKSFENYKKDGKNRKESPTYYQFRINQFNEYWKEFKRVHDEILLCKDTTSDALSYFTKDFFSVFESAFIDALCRIKDDQTKQFPIAVSTKIETKEIPTPESREEVQLPRISIPKFSGDYSSWTSFHDLFKSLIHDNKRIPSVQKLHYLKTSVTGQAEHLLRHYPISEMNYIPAWNLLVQRYENKRVLVNTQLKNLLNQPILNIESCEGIKQLVDTTCESLHALTNLGIDTSTWDSIIIYLIVQKLPTETHQQWEAALGASIELPKLSQFKEFLETRFRVLEALLDKAKTTSKESRMPPRNKFENKFMQSFHSETTLICFICSEPHHLRKCPIFLKMDYANKLNKVKTHGLCINCLGRGHILASCPSKMNCFHCKKRHHTLLHIQHAEQSHKQNYNSNLSLQNTTSATSNEASTSNHHLHAEATPFQMNSLSSQINRNKQVLLATAVIKAISDDGNQTYLRALIDQGSQASFVSETVVQKLKLKRQSMYANVTGVGGCNAGKINSCVNFFLTTRQSNTPNIKIEAFILKTLTNWLPNNSVEHHDFSHLDGLILADPCYKRPGKIDLILGADVYAKILCGGLRRGNEGEPIAQETIFGWIISGEVPNITTANPKRGIVSFHAAFNLEEQLKKFWEIEEMSIPIPKRPEHEICEQIFQQSCMRDSNGRYQVDLPFIHEPKNRGLGKSRDIAISSLLQMERRFQKDPTFSEEYHKCISEYINLGHMLEAKTKENDNIRNTNEVSFLTCNYLPHHAVKKETSTTTKFRVVFDASRKTTSGVCLNDTLYTGPTIQDDLASILLRWRRHKIAFTADIEKMYRQIKVKQQDAEYQRIVWRNSYNESIRDYYLTTVTFGVTCAPYLAIRTLQQLARDGADNFPSASNIILNDFYVDDLLSGSDTLEEGLKLQNNLIKLLDSGGFQLRKWSANDNRLLNTLPKEFREIDSHHEFETSSVKTLGIHWYPNADYFTYKVNMEADLSDYSKRKILGDIARLYDPLGWLAPVIVSAKMFLQSLWLAGLTWDENVPSNLKHFWEEFRKELHVIESIKIQRWLHTDAQSRNYIHGFCDASNKAYAAVLYLISIDHQNRTHTNLLTAKTKVSPIKTISIPRLELCSATLLAKLIKRVKQSLQINIEDVFVWTDSEIVISWLQGHPTKWKTFVANRVTHIHELVGNIRWRHVPSKDNPADCASRGLLAQELISFDMWWNGPAWLKKSKENWPIQKEIIDTTVEVKKLVVSCALNEDYGIEIMNKFSSMTQLISVIAYCQRFIFNCQSKNKSKGSLRPSELRQAHDTIIKMIQEREFSNEINQVKLKQNIKTKSKIINLNPMLDNNGLLRVGGRLQNSALPYNEIHPIILPDKNHFVTLLIRNTHKESLHGGTQLVLSLVRRKYWLLNARNTIKLELHKCTVCYRYKTQTMKQLFGNLPTPRVNITRPFTHTGIDYCGPFQIRMSKGRGFRSHKGYIAVFICLAVKAIHLEAVSDLSSEAFLAAFRRFTSRRGLCSDIYSDCGTNFVGANTTLTKELQRTLKEVTKESADILTKQQITWHFIPPASPHFGGLWEAGVMSVKFHLCRTLRNTTLNFEEFYTVLTQIEAVLNSRPLTELSSDPKDMNALTPGHFLIGEELLSIPEPSLFDDKIHSLSRWKYQQQLFQNFWTRWSHEYLTRLQQRPKWLSQHPNIKIGQLVLIKDERLPPSNWLLGRVIETHTGKDSLIRVATVKTQHSTMKRPITKLCLLPITDNETKRDSSVVTHD